MTHKKFFGSVAVAMIASVALFSSVLTIILVNKLDEDTKNPTVTTSKYAVDPQKVTLANDIVENGEYILYTVADKAPRL